MIDRTIIKRMVSSVREKTVLEIGPGKGALTKELAKKHSVTAVEKDPSLARGLHVPGVRVIQGNTLKQLKHLKATIIVSNLPYAICEPLFHLLPHTPFERGYFTVPQSFARSLHKLPYKAWYEVKELFSVPSSAFSPQPKTRSVFVTVTRKRTLAGAVFEQEKTKVKNAIQKTLFTEKGMTKNQAREALKPLKPSTLQERRLLDLTTKEKEILWIFLERFK